MTKKSIRRKIFIQLFTLFTFLLIAVTLTNFSSIKSFAQSEKYAENNSISTKQAAANNVRKNSKSTSTKWITVDENELNHIQKVIQSEGKSFDLEIVERRGGLSIIKSNELQALDLTRSMHEDFNKCAGFMMHETLAAARLSMKETLQAESNQPVAVYTIDNQAIINPMLSEVHESQIRETITRLSTDFPNRRYNQPSGLDSANWIKDKWTTLAAGRSDITVETFDHTAVNSPQPSIILTVRGTTMPNEVVILGGHQDSINHAGGGQLGDAPGADDDASGIAGLTEVIRVMVAKDFRPRRTVKFMAYAAEEIGLVGSNAIASDYQARGVNVVGVLQLDMTNYKSIDSPYDVRIITDATNPAQNQFVRDLFSIYQPSIAVADGTCGYYCSDHASWYSKGFSASFPFEPSPSNPTIHTPNDTLAQSGDSAENSVKYTKLAVSYLGEMAKGTLGVSYEGDVASRPNGDGSIQSNDVIQIIRFLNEIDVPGANSNEFQRADSAPRMETGGGNGVIDAADVVQTIRYLNELDAPQSAGGPTTPNGSQSLLFAASTSKFGINKSRELFVPSVAPELRVESTNGGAGNEVTVNIRVDAVGDEAQYAFAVLFDPNVLTFKDFAAGETDSQDFSCNATAIAGRVRCSIGTFLNNQAGSDTDKIGEIAAGDNQVLIKVIFNVSSNAQIGTMTPVTFASQSASNDNANAITLRVTDGNVTIMAPTAAAAAVSGRVVTQNGRGISNARIIIRDSNGESQTALSNPFGFYNFVNVPAGLTYIFSVTHKSHTFHQIFQVQTISGNIDHMNFVADK